MRSQPRMTRLFVKLGIGLMAIVECRQNVFAASLLLSKAQVEEHALRSIVATAADELKDSHSSIAFRSDHEVEFCRASSKSTYPVRRHHKRWYMPSPIIPIRHCLISERIFNFQSVPRSLLRILARSGKVVVRRTINRPMTWIPLIGRAIHGSETYRHR